MGRLKKFNSLSRGPKHRWSMLRNMTASLFLYERILTTDARAKSLSKVVSDMFKRTFKHSPNSRDKVSGLLRVNAAKYKLWNDLVKRYKLSGGHLVRVSDPLIRRKGDGAKMMVIELNKNPHEEKEEADFNKIHQESGKEFSNWELFTRQNELDSYKREKEQRDLIYSKLKAILASCKDKSGKIINKEEAKVKILGENINIIKLSQDSLIPPSHQFNLYMKASQNEEELDRYYKKTNSYLVHLIQSAKDQIQLLRDVMTHPRKSKVYEKHNFEKYYFNYREEMDKLQKESQKSSPETKELLKYKQTLAFIRQEDTKALVDSAEFLKAEKNFMKQNGYNPFQLSEEQAKNVDIYRQEKIFESQVKAQFEREKENEYSRLLAKGFVNKKIKKKMETLNKEVENFYFKPQIFRPEVKGNVNNFSGNEFLSQTELENNNLESWKSIVTNAQIEDMQTKKENEEKDTKLRAKRSELESMLWRFFDRQVKKRNKPRLWTLSDTKAEVRTLEAEKQERVKKEKQEIGKLLSRLPILH